MTAPTPTPSPQTLAVHAPEARVALVDREGVIRFVNQAWQDFANTQAGTTATLEGVNYLALCQQFAGLDPAAGRAREGLLRVLQGQAHDSFEYSLPAPHAHRWFLLSITRLDPPMDGALISHLDISHRKRAEQEAAGHKRILEEIAKGFPLAQVLEQLVHFVEEQIPGARCSVLQREGEFLRYRAGNDSLPAFYRELGPFQIKENNGTCGHAAFRNQPTITPNTQQDPNWEPLRELAARFALCACWSFPIATTGPSPEVMGTFAIYQTQPSSPTPEEAQFLTGVAYLASIAMERESTVSALRESEERFRLLVDGIQDSAIVMLDLGGHIRTWNHAAERTYGYRAHEAIGMRWEELESGPLRHRGATEGEVERWQRRQNGERFWASVITSVITNPDGSLRGYAKVIRDLTERRKLEEQLRHAQKMEAVGRLAGGIAHDFNNLLTIISGNTEVLKDDLPEEHQESLLEIEMATGRAAELTRQLLAFGRQQRLNPAVIDLNEILRQRAPRLRSILGAQISLRFSLTPNLPPLKADAGQLEQVLVNLAANARDAMPRGGVFRLETRPIQGPTGLPWIELNVTDNGIGMDDSTRARIFEPFFTTKPLGQGTGLGLAAVHGIIEQSGGTLAVDSQPGQGTTFQIGLPALHNAPQTKAPAPRAAPAHPLLLLVEDEDTVRRLLVRALTTHGYQTIEADNGASALQLLSTAPKPIDMLITDVVMPGMTGPQLAAEVQQLFPRVRVLYITGYEADRSLIAGGERSVLQKPFGPQALLDKVREMLRR